MSHSSPSPLAKKFWARKGLDFEKCIFTKDLDLQAVMLAVNAWSATLAYNSGANVRRKRYTRTPEQKHAYEVKRATKALLGYRDYNKEKAQRGRKRKTQDIEVTALAPLADAISDGQAIILHSSETALEDTSPKKIK